MNWLALSPAEIAARMGGARRRWRCGSICITGVRSTAKFPRCDSGPACSPFRSRAAGSFASPGRCWRRFCFCCCSFWLSPILDGESLFEGRSVVIVFDASIWSQAHPAGGTSVDRPGARGSLAPGGFAAVERSRAAASRGGRCAADSAVHHGSCGAAPGDRRACNPRAAPPISLALWKWAGRRWRVRGAAFWSTSARACSMKSRRGTWMNFARRWKRPAKRSGQPQFLVRLADDRRSPTKSRHHAAFSSPRRRAARSLAFAHAAEKLRRRQGGRRAEAFGERPAARPAARSRSLRANWPTPKMNLSGTRADCCRRKSLPPTNWTRIIAPSCNLPTFRTVHVAVFTSPNSPFAANLLSVLSSNPYVQAQIVPAGNGPGRSSRCRHLSGHELAGRARVQFHLVSQRAVGVERSRSLRVTEWNSQHPVTRWVRTHDVSVRNPATLTLLPERHRTGLHRGKSAGAADPGPRTKWAQDADHRLRPARLQFSAGVRFSVVHGRRHGMDDAFGGGSGGLAFHRRTGHSGSGDANCFAVRQGCGVCAQGFGGASARSWKPESIESSRPAGKRTSPSMLRCCRRSN